MPRFVSVLLLAFLLGCQAEKPATAPPDPADAFDGARAGDAREIAGMKVRWCPAGKFVMGSPPDEPERRPFEQQVEVTLTRGFWIGEFEVTQGDWKRVVGALPGDPTGDGDDFPLGWVNFAEAEEFCAKLTATAHKSGALPATWEFRLPTEAQWEYACRAGTTTATSFGDSISRKQANFKEEPYRTTDDCPSLNRATRVGSYPPNAWGLRDIQGNSCEWCRDWYHARYPGGVNPDLHDAKSSSEKNGDGTYSRSRRGGTWADKGWPNRSAFRQRYEPERKADHIGMRVVAVRP